MRWVLATAGHVDHGKSRLVRRLTGMEPDRWAEERRRGMTIDLGFAWTALDSGERVAFVDVPGHERFVRTMVAGATGIDLFLLVIDASEGARPQTHEHLAILRLLGVERGIVAVTKADAVEPEVVELAVEEARELVPRAEVVPVSAKTGAGLDELGSDLQSPVRGVRKMEAARVGDDGQIETFGDFPADAAADRLAEVVDHLADGRSGGVDPVDRTEMLARRMMIDFAAACRADY